MPTLWAAITSSPRSSRVLLTQGPQASPLLKARLRPLPAHPLALPTLLEALALWQGHKVRAVLGVDATSPMWTSTQLAHVGVDTPLYALHLALIHDNAPRGFQSLRRLLAAERGR